MDMTDPTPEPTPVGQETDLAELATTLNQVTGTQNQMLANMDAVNRKLSSQKLSVSVKDIDMPFGSMVVFMIKWAIASIPATVILALIGLLFWGLVSVACGGLFAGLSNLF